MTTTVAVPHGKKLTLTTSGNWKYGERQPGDEIRQASWDTQFVYFVARPQPMCNLTVATAHTSFVGDEQWLVHNEGSVLCRTLGMGTCLYDDWG